MRICPILPMKAADLPIRDTGLVGSVSETRRDVIILADLPYTAIESCGSAHQRHATRRICIRNTTSHQTPQFHYSLTGLYQETMFLTIIFIICRQLLGALPPDSHRGSALGPRWGDPLVPSVRPLFLNPPLPIIRLGPRPPTS